MKFELAIFDMDGVLVDACEWHRVALNEALIEVCGFKITIDDHISTFNGIPTREKLKVLVNQGKVDQQLIEKIESLKQEKTVDIIEKHANLRKEKIDLIKNLKSNGLKVACYTNSVRFTAELMLMKTGVLDLLDLLITNQDVNNPKPHPEGYLRCMEILNTPASKCVIIEDSPKGIQAAIQSGAEVIKVENADDVDVRLLERLLS